MATILLRLDKQVSRLEVVGSLDNSCAEEFQGLMNDFLEADSCKLLLDLKQAPTINSRCLGKLLLAREGFAERGKELEISGCSEDLFETFQRLRLDLIVPISR